MGEMRCANCGHSERPHQGRYCWVRIRDTRRPCGCREWAPLAPSPSSKEKQ